ncbi:MAG: glycoside hydrolase family 16 protein [Oligoflexus sp.]|nr:glycoside hydrolase family 16 protein [Oligoflexus sp.]
MNKLLDPRILPLTLTVITLISCVRPGGGNSRNVGPVPEGASRSGDESPNGSPAPAKLEGWNLEWSDEFDGRELDETKWQNEVWRPYAFNDELQSYTDHRKENIRVEGGHLVIEARKDGFGGSDYSSGRINSKVGWTYGRMEARIKLPAGRGTWPAFWMLPTDLKGKWPDTGEIDIMEHVGHDPNVIVATLHSTDSNFKKEGPKASKTTKVAGAIDDYHDYAVEWYPDHFDFFADGNKYYTFKNPGNGNNGWPFDKEFHFVLNVAVGGNWGGQKGLDNSAFPAQMLVDYVRVYKKK